MPYFHYHTKHLNICETNLIHALPVKIDYSIFVQQFLMNNDKSVMFIMLKDML